MYRYKFRGDRIDSVKGTRDKVTRERISFRIRNRRARECEEFDAFGVEEVGETLEFKK